MADVFDVLGDLAAHMIRESRKTEAGQLQRAFNDTTYLDNWADRRHKQRVMRYMPKNPSYTSTKTTSTASNSSSDDGLGVGGAALIGGAILGIGALAYKALSSDKSSDTTTSDPITPSQENMNTSNNANKSDSSALSKEKMNDLIAKVQQGDVDSMKKLGDYYRSKGERANAITWYERAAKKGNVPAQKLLKNKNAI